MWIQISLTGQWQNSIYRLTTDLIWERTGFVMALSKMKFSFENVSLPALCDTSSTTQPLCGICERFSQKPRAHWWTATPSPCRSVQLWLLCYFFHTVFALCPLVCLLLSAACRNFVSDREGQGTGNDEADDALVFQPLCPFGADLHLCCSQDKSEFSPSSRPCPKCDIGWSQDRLGICHFLIRRNLLERVVRLWQELPRRVWSLHPWRCPRNNWRWHWVLWAGTRWELGTAWTRWSWRSFPTIMIL